MNKLKIFNIATSKRSWSNNDMTTIKKGAFNVYIDYHQNFPLSLFTSGFDFYNPNGSTLFISTN